MRLSHSFSAISAKCQNVTFVVQGAQLTNYLKLHTFQRHDLSTFNIFLNSVGYLLLRKLCHYNMKIENEIFTEIVNDTAIVTL